MLNQILVILKKYISEKIERGLDGLESQHLPESIHMTKRK